MITNETFIELSKRNPKSPEEIFMKLLEELGEINEAYLILTSADGSNYKKGGLVDFYEPSDVTEKLQEAVLEEFIDLLMVVESLGHKLGCEVKKDSGSDELLKLVSQNIDSMHSFNMDFIARIGALNHQLAQLSNFSDHPVVEQRVKRALEFVVASVISGYNLIAQDTGFGEEFFKETLEKKIKKWQLVSNK